MFARSMVVVGLAGALLAAVPVTADAGGLFGDDGLFGGGDVSKWLDKHIEEPITTPVAQTAVVVAATAGAVAIAGPTGAPVGVALGNGINTSFAGGVRKGPQGQAAQQQAAMGTKCSTQAVGDFSLGSPVPLGSTCIVTLQNGKKLEGEVIR